MFSRSFSGGREGRAHSYAAEGGSAGVGSASFDDFYYNNYGGDELESGRYRSAADRYQILEDLLTEECLMQDITRGLREISKTPSEDSGVELSSNYGLLSARDYVSSGSGGARQSLDRKRLMRSRVLDEDPAALYMRHRSLDIPLPAPYAGGSGFYDVEPLIDTEYRDPLHLPSSYHRDSFRRYNHSSSLQDYRHLQRQDRLPSHAFDQSSSSSRYPSSGHHRQLPSLAATRRSAAAADLLPNQGRVYDPENTHLSKEEFLTNQVHTTNANI